MPAATAAPAVYKAVLKLNGGAGLEVGLYGLATLGEQGEREPPLARVVDALGFAVNVGGTSLSLGTGASPIGEEVRAPRFVRAADGRVTLQPVARYSPDERLPFGAYTGRPPKLEEIAVIAVGNEQTLNPAIEPGGKSGFDPGDAPFGVYAKSAAYVTYTEDALKTGPTKHAVRTYPLKDRMGRPIPNAFLLCMEERANGDYNDYVFVLGNAKPAP